MSDIRERFSKLGIDNAPGQEIRQQVKKIEMKGEIIPGEFVDFSHGDVNAFPPLSSSLENFIQGFREGGKQAYTEYRGKEEIRQELAKKIAEFTKASLSAEMMILTPGTQGALFLAMGSLVGSGDKVAIMEPDYFANRKLVEYFDGEILPVSLDYMDKVTEAGIRLDELETAFKKGAKVFLFSNPNNPTGVIYSHDEIKKIGQLAKKYSAFVVVDELYARQIFDQHEYTHLRQLEELDSDHVLTIMGPSKTESLSGFRLGAAFGASWLIERMEKLQAIVSLRCAGYNQSVFYTWFHEPEGWLEDRVKKHQVIRDDLMALFENAPGIQVRKTEGGSYIFPKVQGLHIDMKEFAKIARVQANVIITPGTEFGPQFTDCFRLNFSQDADKAHNAIVRLLELIERYR